MLHHEFAPLFKLEHQLKDVELALAAGRDAGAPFELAEQAAELLREAVGEGLGERDAAAVVEVLEGRAGTRLAG